MNDLDRSPHKNIVLPDCYAVDEDSILLRPKICVKSYL